MRKLIGHRYVLLGLIGLALLYYAGGQQDAGTGMLLITAILWLVGGRQALIRWRGRAKSNGDRIAQISVRAPFGRREGNLDGCNNRLDPAWRAWLFANASRDASGAVDER